MLDNNLIRKIVLMVATVVPAFAVAQSKTDTAGAIPLTINQVWEKAAVNNKVIQMQQLALQGRQELVKDAKTERLPEITAQGMYARVSNMPLYSHGIFNAPEQYPVLHNYYTFGGEAYFNIYNGKKTDLKINEEKTEQQIAEQQKNLATSNIKLQAAASYLDLQRGLMFKTLLTRDIADQEKQLEQILQLQKHGVVLKSDILRAQLQLSRLRLSLDQINNDIAIATQKLNIIIGQPDSVNVNPVDRLTADSIVLRPYDDYLNFAVNHAFQYKISEKETELKALQLKDVKANVSPKVGLFANYAYTYPQIQFFPYSADFYGLGMYGVKASFSISSFYYNKHKEKAAELDYKRQEVEHSNTADQVRQQVNEAYLRFQQALRQVNVARTNVTQATENARIVNNTYFNQLSLVTDLLDANTQLLQTRFDLAAAQISAQMQYYQLQNAIGNL